MTFTYLLIYLVIYLLNYLTVTVLVVTMCQLVFACRLVTHSSNKNMSVVLTAGSKCTLAASNAAIW